MKCIIPCAGLSSRMSFVPKHLIQIDNRPLIHHVVDSWKDEVDTFIFVIRRSMTYMLEYLPEHSIVVFQDNPKGLADAVLQAEPCITSDERFVITLGDCLNRGCFQGSKTRLSVGVWQTNSLSEINKSYLVYGTDRVVYKLVEKPKLLTLESTANCGMGTYFMDQRVFEYIRRSNVLPGGGDFTSVLQNMINAGEMISPNWFKGDYINVTQPDDIKKAEEILHVGTSRS